MSSPLRRMLRLAGLLNESVADSPEVNAEIERRIAGKSDDEKVVMRDALDVLKDAGTGGLTPKEWAAGVRAIHGDPEMSMGDVLKSVTRELNNVVSRTDAGRYVWMSGEGVAGASDTEVDLVGQQVGAAHDAIKIMQEMPSFTRQSLARMFVSRLAMPGPNAVVFAQHMIDQMQGSLEKVADGYRMKKGVEASRDGNMQMFRDIVSKASETGGEPV